MTSCIVLEKNGTLICVMRYWDNKFCFVLKMGICCSTKPLEKQTSVKEIQIARTPFSRKTAKQRKTEKLTELKAAMLIQKWFRVWMNQLQSRREIAWSIFQKIEYYGERNQMKLNRFFRILFEEFQTSKTDVALSKNMKSSETTLKDENVLMVIPDDIEVNILPPYTVENLNLLMNFLKKGKNLHYTCVINLLIMATEKMKIKPNINEVSTSITQKITICGDLHGSLDDLLTIFYKNDIPSLANPYIFNGDIVDRGPKSVEVAMILCYCFLLFPNHVHLNRGNHEDPYLNEKYGFLKEIMTKYRCSNKKIFTLFINLFKQLPLGTIIDHKIFVVHGGISNKTNLNFLTEIERYHFSSVIKPAINIIQRTKSEWEQISDILWSDPSPEDGCIENECRGGGKFFGPDVTEEFLRTHNFQLLIRSHECKPEGYEYDHSGKVLTVFSSSNYYHPGSNKGAYIVYTGDLKQLRHFQYLSNDESLKNINFKEKTVSMEEKAINDLKRMLFTNRNQLLKRFKEYDEKETGKVTIEEYGMILKDILKMNLPWKLVQPKISKCDKNNLVIYETSFDFGKDIKDESASDILFSNLDILETIFRAIDKDNSGLITMAEFSNAMAILQKHSDIDISIEDMKELGELIDSNKDGYIDINEFFEAFKISRT